MKTVERYDILLTGYKDAGFDMEWTMKDGTNIKIRDMEDSHVRNCIRMMKSKPTNQVREVWIKIFTDVEMKRRKLKLEKICSRIGK